MKTSRSIPAETDYFKPRFDYWRKFDTLKAWEIASLMRGVDPHALTDLLIPDPSNPLDEIGVPLDLSEEIRMLAAACRADLIKRVGDQNAADGSADITVKSLVPWLAEKGHAQLAKNLLGQKVTDAERNAVLLARLRALGGDVQKGSSRGRWKITGIGKLESALSADGEKLDPKTLRRYLHDAADREAASSREGDASKPKARGPFEV